MRAMWAGGASALYFDLSRRKNRAMCQPAVVNGAKISLWRFAYLRFALPDGFQANKKGQTERDGGFVRSAVITKGSHRDQSTLEDAGVQHSKNGGACAKGHGHPKHTTGPDDNSDRHGTLETITSSPTVPSVFHSI